MGRRSIIGISALVVLGLAWLPGRAVSQHKSGKEQLLGAWSLVSIEFVRPDGSRSSTFGANPNGIAFFDATGHYIISVMRSDRAKYAINNFAQGTDEENKATAQGSITYFGTYSVSEGDQTIAIHIEGSSFPNWNGADQKRIFAITEDELKLTSPAATGAGTAEVVWKRAK
jgi:Lipocalin-like domain